MSDSVFIDPNLDYWRNIFGIIPVAHLVNIVAVHTNYQLHDIVADFLGQRTGAEAQFDECSQEVTRKKIKGQIRAVFLMKSMNSCCRFWTRYITPRWGQLYKKYEGARLKFRKEPLRGTMILFSGRGLNFSPLRSTNSKTTHYLLSYFAARYPKRCRESSRCGPFEADHPKGNKTTF